MKRTVGAVGLALTLSGTLALASPRCLRAQGLEVRVRPVAGVLTPADWFYEEFKHFGVEPLEWTEAAVRSAAVAGVAVDVAPAGLGASLRAEVLRTLGGTTSVTHAVLRGVQGYDPPQVFRTPYEVESAITWASLQVVLPTRLVLLGAVQPYFIGGVAAKRYDFDVRPLVGLEDDVVFPREGVVPSAELGVGLDLEIFGLDLDVLLRDSISKYWDKQQHDVMVVGGFTLQVL